MKKRWIFWSVWLAAVFCLYFFENNAGTLAVLCGSLALPFLEKRGTEKEEAKAEKQVIRRELLPGKETEFTDIRPYRPGDPVSLIHWKLTAKLGRPLIREPEPVEGDESVPVSVMETEEDHEPFRKREKRRKRWMAGLILSAGILLAVLFLFPVCRESAKALANRIFAASEAVNDYRYHFFAADPGVSPAAASALAGVAAVLLFFAAALSRSRIPLLLCMLGFAGFQIYFGLSFAPWINLPVFAAAGVRAFRPAPSRKTAALAVTAVLLMILAALLFLPGVNPDLEAFSERIRDRLTPHTEILSGKNGPEEEGWRETRHVHTRSLKTGEREAEAEKRFQLKKNEEQPISLPHWVDYLRIAGMLVLSVLTVVLPFAPFAFLASRRRKAEKARLAFESEDVREAVCALFGHVNAYLEASGLDGGNRLYRTWTEDWDHRLPETFIRRYRECVPVFEEAFYSFHPMREEQREQMKTLLAACEELLYDRADRWQRMKLKYGKCLHA